MGAPVQNTQTQNVTTGFDLEKVIQNSVIKDFPDLVEKFKQFVKLDFERRKNLLIKFYENMIKKTEQQEYKIKFQTTILILQSYEKNEENSQKINDLYKKILEASAKNKLEKKQEELQKLQQAQMHLQKLKEQEKKLQEEENPDDLLNQL